MSEEMSEEMKAFAGELSALLKKHGAEIYPEEDYGSAYLKMRRGAEEITLYGEINGGENDFETVGVRNYG